MLISPANWYFAVPSVTTTCPFNLRFIRDMGSIFLLVAIAILIGVARPASRVPLWCAAALWLAGMHWSISGWRRPAYVKKVRCPRIFLLRPYRLY
jgi:hypothetical protein